MSPWQQRGMGRWRG